MITIININIGIKEPTRGHQNCNTNPTLIFGGYLKVVESLFTQVIIWLIAFYNILVLGRCYLGIKVLACYVGTNGIENKNMAIDSWHSSVFIVRAFFTWGVDSALET